jgi:hypothetical protein
VTVRVAIEVGPKRKVLAQAVAWPGWCRVARDETRALEALASAATRYRKVLGRSLAEPLGSDAPELRVVERASSTTTTD